MQNRNTEQKHNEMTMSQFSALNAVHNEMHQVEDMLTLTEFMQGGASVELVLNQLMVANALNEIHAAIEHHTPEIIAQQNRINSDLASKAKDVGEVISSKNAVKETFAQSQGMFSAAIVRRRAEVEAMLNASARAAAEKSASSSDKEEASSAEASPTMSPRM